MSLTSQPASNLFNPSWDRCVLETEESWETVGLGDHIYDEVLQPSVNNIRNAQSSKQEILKKDMYELATILLRDDQELTLYYAYREQQKSRLATASHNFDRAKCKLSKATTMLSYATVNRKDGTNVDTATGDANVKQSVNRLKTKGESIKPKSKKQKINKA